MDNSVYSSYRATTKNHLFRVCGVVGTSQHVREKTNWKAITDIPTTKAG